MIISYTFIYSKQINYPLVNMSWSNGIRWANVEKEGRRSKFKMNANLNGILCSICPK